MSTSKLDWAKPLTASKPPNEAWKAGDGMTSNDILQLDPELYEQFDRSRSATGQEELFKRIDPAETAPNDLYKLMIGGIIPRPIGFVSSVDAKGVCNLAPFSYFNACGHQPPMIFLFFTIGSRKDSCANIKATKEFTVNIISEPFVEAANYTAIDAPDDISEWSLSGLTQTPSRTIKPPRVAESAYNMECVLEHFYDVHSDSEPEKVTGTVVLGRVKLFHVRKDIINPRGGIDIGRFRPVSRVGGISYGRTTESYEIPRPKYADVKESEAGQSALHRGEKSTQDVDDVKSKMGNL